MPQSITVAMVQQYSANVLNLAQQKFSRFKGKISWEKITAEGAYFERLGRVEAQQNNTRFADTPSHEIEHSRRHVSLSEWIINLPLDRADAAQILIDPLSRYAQAAAAGMGRKMDDLVLAAAFGTAATGKDASGTETWPQNNAKGHSMQIAHGGVGLTKAKIILASRLLNEGEVEQEDRYMAYDSQGLEDLLNDDTLTTRDRLVGEELQATGGFGTPVLQQGQFARTWMGFQWFLIERLPKVTTTASCVAFQAQSLGVKYAIEMDARVGERPDKNYAMQAWQQMVMGAVRIDPERIVEVQITEDA